MFKKTVFFVGFLFYSISSFAFSVFINPVILKLESKQQVLSFSVTNKSDANMTFQLRGEKWSQKDGIDNTVNTSDIIITPPVVTVPPGSEQIVRVGLRNPTPRNVEGTYRVSLRQLPIDLKKHDKNSLTVLLAFSLPLFIAPAQENKVIVWDIKKIASDKLYVRLINKGNVHIEITHLALQDAGGKIYSSSKAMGRVLSGQSQTWTLSLKKILTDKRITVNATTDWDGKYRELNVVAPVS